ncbi:MAG TPA: SPW repeat protein [Thermoleophilia bacterium]|nr:SPW repeat protein [Thermoleophilia bacterium]
MIKNHYIFWGGLGLVALGVWRIIMPYAAGYSSHTFALWNDIVCGALIIAFGLWATVDNGSTERYWSTMRKSIPTLGAVAIGVYTLVICFSVLYTSIGRFNTFYEMAVAMATLVLGLFLTRSRFAHMPDQLAQRDMPAHRDVVTAPDPTVA